MAELRDSVKLDDDHIAAFSDDCSTMSKRFSLIDVSAIFVSFVQLGTYERL